MSIQFHLTSKCNFRCKHCYQDEYEGEIISLDDFKYIIQKTKDYFANTGMADVIFLTGGEPFIIPDFYDYLKYSSENFKKVGIMSNGSLLNQKILRKIKNNIPNLARIQVSLEGPEPVNDEIRGAGTYKIICDAIRMIRDANIICSVSCTIAPYNYDRILELYDDLAHNVHPNFLWFDRCIPYKDAGVLTTEQFQVFLDSIKSMQEMRRDEELFTRPMGVRALQFLAGTQNPIYKCGAGARHFTLLQNGDVMICRRLNYAVGNLFKEEWADIMARIEPEIAAIHRTPDNCVSCKYANSCNGGLKCLTHTQFGDFNHKDINCPL